MWNGSSCYFVAMKPTIYFYYVILLQQNNNIIIKYDMLVSVVLTELTIPAKMQSD